jgi:hypothetical protein
VGRKLGTDDEVKAAVDELLAAFAAPTGTQPDDTGFSEEKRQRLPARETAAHTAPSADAEALWGSKPKKKK